MTQNARPTGQPRGPPQSSAPLMRGPAQSSQGAIRLNHAISMYKLPDGSDAADFKTLQGRLDSRLLNAIDQVGFKKMSPVQHIVLNNLPTYRSDCLVQAKTGTGKTIAFLLPALDALLKEPNLGNKVGILIISPTRELAMQIAQDCDRLTALVQPRLECHTAYGGTNRDSSLRRFKAGKPAILVATPGRLKDILGEPDVLARFSNLKTLILDEADTMLDAQGHFPDVKKILDILPKKSAISYQGMCFSATVPPKVKTVVDVVLRPGYTTLSTVDETEEPTHKTVPQTSIVIPGIENMFTGLYVVLQHYLANASKAIVFGPTANLTGLFYDTFSLLLGNTIPTFETHSRLTQSSRERTTAAFKSATRGVLFASDVVGRGLDFPDVDLVIQTGVPVPKEQYVHRVGRTGRAGKSGLAIILLNDHEAYWPSANRAFPIRPTPAPLQESLATAALSQAVHAQLAAAMSQVDPKSKQKAYKSYLGGMSNKGLLKPMGLDREGLVQLTNRLAVEGMRTDGVPPVTRDFAGKAGFKGVAGLNVVSVDPYAPAAASRGGGGRGAGAPRQAGGAAPAQYGNAPQVLGRGPRGGAAWAAPQGMQDATPPGTAAPPQGQGRRGRGGLGAGGPGNSRGGRGGGGGAGGLGNGAGRGRKRPAEN